MTLWDLSSAQNLVLMPFTPILVMVPPSVRNSVGQQLELIIALC